MVSNTPPKSLRTHRYQSLFQTNWLTDVREGSKFKSDSNHGQLFPVKAISKKVDDLISEGEGVVSGQALFSIEVMARLQAEALLLKYKMKRRRSASLLCPTKITAPAQSPSGSEWKLLVFSGRTSRMTSGAISKFLLVSPLKNFRFL